ncbi:hypothetical protein ACFVIM_12000 [Streptomyces sp. NPDC057638]|uniref:hypothetical protein n=1 Tax=Streptomyces sp. NPDC057638 TaxID=3346190 RepID=UPI0036911E5E
MWQGRIGRLFRRAAPTPGAGHTEAEAAITALGIALDEHAFAPGQPGATDAMRDDLGRALDAYEEAKRALAGAEGGREAVFGALRAVDEGRSALARLDARLAGDEVVERPPLCFFDPRHGVSTTRVFWAPDEGAARHIAVCAADAARLSDGRAPMGPPPPPPVRTGVRGGPAPRATPPRGSGRGTGAGSGRAAPVAPARELQLHEREIGSDPRWVKTPTITIPVIGEPAVLLFRTDRPSRVTVSFAPPRKGRDARTYTLGGGSQPVRAALPMVRAGNKRVIRFSVTFPDHVPGDWWARSEELATVPTVDGSAEGFGYTFFHYTGPRAPGVLRHQGRGPFLLQALDGDLHEGAVLARGKGDGSVPFVWPGEGYYQVRCREVWELRTAD